MGRCVGPGGVRVLIFSCACENRGCGFTAISQRKACRRRVQLGNLRWIKASHAAPLSMSNDLEGLELVPQRVGNEGSAAVQTGHGERLKKQLGVVRGDTGSASTDVAE